jgi:hypothetical protein
MTAELIEAKRNLLSLLLKKDYKKLTDPEIDIMVALTADQDIQTILERRKNWKIDTVLVEGDHPIARRIYKLCLPEEAGKLVDEMKEIGYENITIDGKEIL